MAARYRINKFDTSSIVGSTDSVATAILATDTSITLTSGTATVNGTQIQIGAERMLIQSGGGTATLAVQRGFGGTTPAAYSIGASVSVPGALVLNLLQIAKVPNQSFTFVKSTTDIHYVKLVPYPGSTIPLIPADTLPGGAATVILADESANLGTSILTAPGIGNQWILTAGAGGSGSAGASAGTGGPTPTAPNITSATAVAAYSLFGIAPVFAIGGVITLPTTATNYADLATITVMATAPGATTGNVIATLTAPFSGSTVAYTGIQLPQPTTAQTWTISFICSDASATPTPSPVTVTVAVGPSAVTAITGGDASALSTSDPKYVARYADATGSPHTAIWMQVTCAGSYPQVVAIYYDMGDGAGFRCAGDFTVTGPTDVLYFTQVWVPTNGDATWTLGAIAGWQNFNGSTPVPLPTGAVESATFTVAQVGTVPAGEFGLSFQPNPSTGLLYDYAGPFNPGYYTWNWYDLRVVVPTADVNLWEVNFTVQSGYVVSGVFTPATDPTGVEKTFGGLAPAGLSVQALLGQTVDVLGPTALVNNTAVPDWGFPANTTNWVVRIRAYGLSRRGTLPTGGGTAAATLLTGWPSGADHFDLQPGTPPNSLNASALTLGTVSASLITTVNASAITSVNASAITTVNATAITGSIVAGQIGSVSATSITGSVVASQISSVLASTITGSIVASQISSLATTQLTGSILSSQISSVATTQLTGSILAGQISSIVATQITGVIVSSQLVSQIIDSANLIATSGVFSNGITNNGSTVAITPSGMTSGSWTAGQIGSVNTSSFVGLIVAGQINTLAATQLTGSIVSTQIASVHATAITGTVTAGQIASVNASSISGTLTSSQIGSVNATTITIGLIGPTQISSINASQLNAGTIVVGSGGITFSGSGGISMAGGGNIIANPGYVSGQSLISASNITANQSGIGGGYYVNSVQVINSSAQFVGDGINCPLWGAACAGFNPFVGGVQYFGASLSFQDLVGNVHTFKGGVLVS